MVWPVRWYKSWELWQSGDQPCLGVPPLVWHSIVTRSVSESSQEIDLVIFQPLFCHPTCQLQIEHICRGEQRDFSCRELVWRNAFSRLAGIWLACLAGSRAFVWVKHLALPQGAIVLHTLMLRRDIPTYTPCIFVCQYLLPAKVVKVQLQSAAITANNRKQQQLE